jgi:hypothetical protein
MQIDDTFSVSNVCLEMVKHSSGHAHRGGMTTRRPLRRLRSRSLSPETMKQSLQGSVHATGPFDRRKSDDILNRRTATVESTNTAVSAPPILMTRSISDSDDDNSLCAKFLQPTPPSDPSRYAHTGAAVGGSVITPSPPRSGQHSTGTIAPRRPPGRPAVSAVATSAPSLPLKQKRKGLI